MTRVPLRRGAALVALCAATLTARGATAQPADGGLQPREIAARAQASLLVVRAIGPQGDTLGEGTGFVVDRKGTFVTNYHVVEPAASVEVQPLDGAPSRTVLLVAADPQRDLAVLRAPELEPGGELPLGDDSVAVIGDRIYVMGNPLGMSGTFSDGLVSARRPVHGTSMLQISAPISPGSSGGPVMNERAEVIGVAAMMVVGGQNISLAVPSRYVRPLLVVTDAPRPFTAAALPRREGGITLAAQGSPGVGNLWRQQVLQQMSSADSVMRGNGLRLVGPVRLGAARQGQRQVEEFELEEGTRYFILARCDHDCTELDLRLSDGSGHTVAEDGSDGDLPTVSFVSEASGRYRAVVGMARCNAEPCAYGVAVYRMEANRISALDKR
jgi:serine protease Do